MLNVRRGAFFYSVGLKTHNLEFEQEWATKTKNKAFAHVHIDVWPACAFGHMHRTPFFPAERLRPESRILSSAASGRVIEGISSV